MTIRSFGALLARLPGWPSGRFAGRLFHRRFLRCTIRLGCPWRGFRRFFLCLACCRCGRRRLFPEQRIEPAVCVATLALAGLGWLVWLPGEWLIFRRHGGIIPAWIWLTVYVLILAIGFWWRWQSGRWKQVDLIEREVPLIPTRTGAEGLVVSD